MTLVWKHPAASAITGHDALHVDEHRLHGPGGDGQLLLQEVARDGHALPHQDLVGGAADAGDVDAAGALLPGFLQHGRVVGHVDDHLCQCGLVPVHEDVDLVLAEHAEVDLGPNGLGRAEEDVLQVGGDHRSTPAVRQRGAHAPEDDGLVVGVDTHVGAMHDVDDLAVDAPGGDVQLLPVLPLLLGRALDELDAVLLRSERGEAGLGDLLGDLLDRLALALDAQLVGQGVQLLPRPRCGSRAPLRVRSSAAAWPRRDRDRCGPQNRQPCRGPDDGATMLSSVAPQTPTFVRLLPGSPRLQGPIWQIEQQMPSSPTLHWVPKAS